MLGIMGGSQSFAMFLDTLQLSRVLRGKEPATLLRNAMAHDSTSSDSKCHFKIRDSTLLF